MKSFLLSIALLLSVLGHADRAVAHTSSNGFVDLIVDGERISGKVAVAVRDLEFSLGLDQDGDASVTWSELASKEGAIAEALKRHLVFRAGQGACATNFDNLLIDRRSDGAYAVVPFTSRCPVPGGSDGTVSVSYTLFFEENPLHRGLLHVGSPGTGKLLVATPDANQFVLDAQATRSEVSKVSLFLEGVSHIWHGYDHILFLLSLLIPSVLIRREKRYQPATSGREALLTVVRVVTAFTLAHSITLSLAAFDVVRVPSRFVEVVIALSVLLAAMNNVFPFVKESRLWWAAFLFGLIHGFGFASAMQDFGLQGPLLLWSVVLFNIGVEAGQLAIVSAFFPIAFLARKTRTYRVGVVWAGSLAISVIALYWVWERLV